MARRRVTDRREFGHAEPALTALVITGCAWELIALTTRRLPTVSRISRRWPVIGQAVLTVLDIHFRPFEPAERRLP